MSKFSNNDDIVTIISSKKIKGQNKIDAISLKVKEIYVELKDPFEKCSFWYQGKETKDETFSATLEFIRKIYGDDVSLIVEKQIYGVI